MNGQDMRLYSGVPSSSSGTAPYPAVVVIQSAGGVGEFLCGIVDKLAEAGFAAAAPDLYHRITDPNLTENIAKAQSLSDPDVIADVNAAVDWLRNHPSVDQDRLGITGFCMGGRIAWLAAAVNPHFKATVPYFGGNIMVIRGSAEKSPFELTSGINCPMLFHFGELDENPSQEDMAKLDAELTRLGKLHQFHTYPGADHAFMDHTGLRFNQEAADASWPRTLEFFAAHLKGAAVSR